MHDSVSSKGTPNVCPRAITFAFDKSRKGAATTNSLPSPSESERDIASVASGNGLPASTPSAIRDSPRWAQAIAARVSRTRLRPTRYTSSSGVSKAGGLPVTAQWVAG